MIHNVYPAAIGIYYTENNRTPNDLLLTWKTTAFIVAKYTMYIFLQNYSLF